MILCGKQITLVIPTYNRHSLLEKTLRYYDAFNIPILVVDSSDVAFKKVFCFHNVEYLHRPGEEIPHKLIRPIIDYVKTPYMFMSADDMVIAPEAVAKCLSFLEENPDYSMAQGTSFGVGVFPENPSEMLVINANEGRFSVDISSQESQLRILELFCEYVPTFYGVFRSDVWKWQLSLYPATIANYHLAEYFFAMMTAFAGKLRILPYPYFATLFVPPIASGNKRLRDDLIRLMTTPSHAEEYAVFCSVVSSALSQQAEMSQERALSIINKSLTMHAWEPKPILSAKQKVVREIMSCTTKLIDRKGLAQRRALRRKAVQDAYRENTAHYLSLSGLEEKRIAQCLADALKIP